MSRPSGSCGRRAASSSRIPRRPPRSWRRPGRRWSPGRRRSATLPTRWTCAFGPTCSRHCRGGSPLPAIRDASTRNSSLRCCRKPPPRPRSPATRSSRWSGSGRGTPSTRWRTAGSACGCRPARRSSNWSSSATSGISRGSLPARSGRSSSTNPLLTSCESSCRPGGGVAGQPVCAYLVGRRRFVLVDPGDPTGPALERCLEEAAARGGEISAIALTHADPDHHGGAEGLAERLDIPVFAGPGASRRLPYQVRELADGADHRAWGRHPPRACDTGPAVGPSCLCRRRECGRADRRSRRPARRPDAARPCRRCGLGSVARPARHPRRQPPAWRTSRAMSDPTGSAETPDWPEARGPHLPDVIARVPGPVWPFLALTVLAAFGRWQELSASLARQPDRRRRADRRAASRRSSRRCWAWRCSPVTRPRIGRCRRSPSASCCSPS